VSVLARTDPPRPRSISTLLTQIWLLERARLQSWHRCSGVQNTEPYRCLMLHVPPLLCTYRFFWVTMIKPLISSLASVLIKARQQSQWILVLLDNAAVHSPHAVLQVCHLNFCPSACPDHFLSRILGLLSTVQRRPTSQLGEEWAAAGWLTSTRLTSLPFPADEAEFSGRYDVSSSLVGRSSLSRVSVGSSSPGPANDPAQPAHAVFGAARPRQVTVRVVLAVTSAQTFVLRIMPHGQSGRVKTEAESCVRFGYA
jgi:hypothetical protein